MAWQSLAPHVPSLTIHHMKYSVSGYGIRKTFRIFKISQDTKADEFSI